MEWLVIDTLNMADWCYLNGTFELDGRDGIQKIELKKTDLMEYDITYNGWAKI